MVSTTRRLVSPALTLPLDVLAVGLFALVGRLSHDEAVSPEGVWETAWPFLAGLALGWAVVRWRSGSWPAHLGHGVTVWVCTVGLGMALRALTGAGVALSFVLVAALVLGLLLLGGRTLLARGPRPA